MANLVAGALMFHRGDVQAAKTTVLRNNSEYIFSEVDSFLKSKGIMSIFNSSSNLK
jgi:hypothetical protein